MNPQKTAAKDVRVSKLSMVILFARDPIASLAFYRDLLGMKVTEQSPEWVELDGGGVSIALHSHPNVPAKRDGANPWIVFGVDDVRGTYEALLAKGAKFLTEPKQVCGDETYVGLSADLHDPDGNQISIFGKVPAGS
jgi:catechol 2,3-dioxygenase-like lactoylglutathione lyase family enzyme